LPTAAFDSSERRYAYYTALADRVRAIPGVRAVAAGTSRPLSSGGPTVVNTGADDAPTAPRISTQDVTPEFFEALGIPSVAGRPFDQRDAADGAPAVILNVRAARDLFGSATSAIGRRVRLDSEPWREVVGVVGDVRSTFFNTLEWRTDPIVYRPAAQAFSTLTSPAATSFGFHLHVRADRSLSADEVRRVVRFADPRALFTGLDTASRLIDEATRQPLFRMRLLSWFAGLSLLLAAVGIYALVSQAVNQRTRELAVRLVLGATRGTVMMSVARRAIETTGAGLAIGAIVAYVLGGNLRSLLYGVQPRDAMSFLVPAVALAAVSALAAFVPARRVTRIDPAQALRAE
jgi:putative ABC transport system permease protein